MDISEQNIGGYSVVTPIHMRNVQHLPRNTHLNRYSESATKQNRWNWQSESMTIVHKVSCTVECAWTRRLCDCCNEWVHRPNSMYPYWINQINCEQWRWKGILRIEVQSVGGFAVVNGVRLTILIRAKRVYRSHKSLWSMFSHLSR